MERCWDLFEFREKVECFAIGYYRSGQVVKRGGILVRFASLGLRFR
jgi:hypothetical protein